MTDINVYRYRMPDMPDTPDNKSLMATRTGTREAIALIDSEIFPEEKLSVALSHVNAEGWTTDGYWDRNKPPFYM